MSNGEQLDSGDSGRNPWRTFLLRYFDPNNPNLIAKVDFAGLIRDGFRTIALAIVLGITTIVLAAFDAIAIAIDGAREALVFTLTGLGLSPTVLQDPAQVATVEAISGAGLGGLPLATLSQLASFGVIALVFALAWGVGR